MTPRRKRCDSCGQEFGFHSATCSVWPPRPLRTDQHLAQIAESLKSVGEFFEALRDGRVSIQDLPQTHRKDIYQKEFRVVISPKSGDSK